MSTSRTNTSAGSSLTGETRPVLNRVEKSSDVPLNAPVPTDLRWPGWACARFTSALSLGGFLFGYESGVISGIMAFTSFQGHIGEVITNEMGYPIGTELSRLKQSLIVSLFCVGAIFGAFLGSKVVDKLGRRWTSFALAMIYFLGTVVEWTSMFHSFWWAYPVGRILTGFGIGGMSGVVPMYLSESVSKDIRGLAMNMYSAFLSMGFIFAFLINFMINKFSAPGGEPWIFSNIFGTIVALVLLICLFFCPESPRYEYQHGDKGTAQYSIARLSNRRITDPVVLEEVNDLEAEYNETIAIAAAPKGFFSIFKKVNATLRRTLIGLAIMIGQQFTGINFFFYYVTEVFANVGLSDPFLVPIIMGIANIAGTVAGLFVVQYVGRRTALKTGIYAMVVCLVAYAMIGHFGQVPGGGALREIPGLAIIAVSCLFVITFCMTWGPLGWSVIFDLYPSATKSHCISLCAAVNWGTNFLIAFMTPMITKKIGYLLGCIFAGVMVAEWFVIHFFLIESKGYGLEEVDIMYRTGVDAKTSEVAGAVQKGEKKERV